MQELRDDFSALYVQHAALMAKMQSDANASNTGGTNFGRNYFATRQSKIGFPVFAVDQTPAEERVKIAVINLEGKGLQWFHNWAKFRMDAIDEPWDVFVKGLEERFGDKMMGDPMAELLAFKQSGTVSDYHDQFELLLGRVDVSESYAVSFFLNGLKFRVQKAVRMFMPKSIAHALSLARLHESSGIGRDSSFQNVNARKPNQFEPGQSTYDSRPLLPSPAPNTFKPRRTLSSEELDDKRAKGLCYWCNEKYERGHRCAKKQLYLIELPKEEEAEEQPEEESEPGESDNPHISMHAIHGSSSKNYRTMRVTGRVGKKSLNILIDSGSTHNFLDVKLAKRLGLKLTAVKPMRVDVADGNSITCKYMAKAVRWSLQDAHFITDVFLLSLGICDMVLGIHWLETLGVIEWDFKNLSMTFYIKDRKHVLRGSPRDTHLQAISGKSLMKMIPECSEMQLCCLKLQEEVTPKFGSHGEGDPHGATTPPEVLEFLAAQEDIFKEPTTLPPTRDHDHHIVLKEGYQPVSIRPYRHSSVQKDIIEKMVSELLHNGFI